MYFDPGTGSMIVQIIVASIASIGALFITFKDNIIGFIRGSRGKSDQGKKE